VLDEDARKLDEFVVERSPLKSVTTPLSSSLQIRYEAAAVLYAASGRGVLNVGIVHGSGTGSTQVSAVQENGAIVGISFFELGSKKGVECLKNNKHLGWKVAVEQWENEINSQLVVSEIAVDDPIEDQQSKDDQKSKDQKSTDQKSKNQLCTEFFTEKSKSKTVVGISAFFYAMSGTEEIKKLDKTTGLPCIKHSDMVKALENKLDDLLMECETENFDQSSILTEHQSSILTELANVKLQLCCVKMLYDQTAKFTLAREWKVHGKPFRTTWSTGWYVTHLPPVSAATVISALLTPSSFYKGTSTI
jgi:hypothetical protein